MRVTGQAVCVTVESNIDALIQEGKKRGMGPIFN